MHQNMKPPKTSGYSVFRACAMSRAKDGLNELITMVSIAGLTIAWMTGLLASAFI